MCVKQPTDIEIPGHDSVQWELFIRLIFHI